MCHFWNVLRLFSKTCFLCDRYSVVFIGIFLTFISLFILFLFILIGCYLFFFFWFFNEFFYEFFYESPLHCFKKRCRVV